MNGFRNFLASIRFSGSRFDVYYGHLLGQGAGYPTADRDGWSEFEAEHLRTHDDMWHDFDAFVQENGAPSLGELEFMHESPYLNLYVYPAEADYARRRPLAPAT